ncbi:hypothetical protein [Rufibacter sp. XAAS-G3-1]|uniref:hypothetical protein n=1 Tax=Rufibacter sp. XAAS-G3-1 TaxID=2729134 RepID=UPI0015E7177B|nr:hypothetical protein [Rufibacter sp. XAAS-G3-1]
MRFDVVLGKESLKPPSDEEASPTVGFKNAFLACFAKSSAETHAGSSAGFIIPNASSKLS